MKNQRIKSAKLRENKKPHIDIIDIIGDNIDIIGDSMLNGIHERGMNKYENIKVKIRKYPGAFSIDIFDHIKPSLRKPTRTNYNTCWYE